MVCACARLQLIHIKIKTDCGNKMYHWKCLRCLMILLDLSRLTCAAERRECGQTCAHSFSLFFFECVCAYVSVITHLRMAHWSFAHNNDMLVLPTHKCALALHTAPLTVHSAQDGRIMHEDSVQKHKNDVFCCWIFNNKKKNEKTNKNTMHVYREMKCIYTNAMILCRQRTSWRIGCVFDWNKYIHSINTQNAFREQKWRLKWTPNGENEKRKYYRGKLLYAYSHNHWHFSLMRSD